MDDLIAATRQKGVTYSLDFHSHEQHELILLHGGNCRFLIGNQFYHLQPGNLLMLDGSTIHKAYVYGDVNAYERSIVQFRSEWIRPLLKELNVEHLLDLFQENNHGLIRHFPKKEEAIVESKMRELARIWDGPDYVRDPIEEAQLKVSLTQLLMHIYQSNDTLVRKEETQRDEKTELVERISNYLFSNYHRSISIEDISHAVGLTKSYMSHLFKEITGNTIMNYLMTYRLSQARNQLVENPDQTIKDVSQECGFKSEAHFSRYFKKNIGVTPTEYRSGFYTTKENDKQW